MCKPKVINLRFEFEPEDWAYCRRFWTESEIRHIIMEEGLGQLRALAFNQEEMAENDRMEETK